jgi:hypothetical protein
MCIKMEKQINYKKKSHSYALYLGLILLLFSCNYDKNDKILKNKKDSVIALHDCINDTFVKKEITLRTKLDSLDSDKDIIKFLEKNYPYLKDENICFESKYFIPSKDLKYKKWEITDIDNNGENDLLINIFYHSFLRPIVIKSQKGKFDITFIRNLWDDQHVDEIMQTTSINNIPILKTSFIKRDTNYIGTVFKTCLLISKFGEFIEYNPCVFKQEISSLDIKIDAGTIEDDETSIDAHIDFVKNEGNCKTETNWSNKKSNLKLSKNEIKSIYSILNYEDVDNLATRKDTAGWSDSFETTYKINMANGKTITYFDNAMTKGFALYGICHILMNKK